MLTKFIDFASSLYPDSIAPIKKADPPLPPSNTAAVGPPQAMGKTPRQSNNMEEEKDAEAVEGAESGNDTKCPTCEQAISLLPSDTVPEDSTWQCSFPGHDGPNSYTAQDPCYGCPTATDCAWLMCETCYNNIQNSEAAIRAEEEEEQLKIRQPEGTRSKYNDDYYCDVESLTFKTGEVGEGLLLTVSYNVRGDGSLGPLQSPSTSKLYVGDNAISSFETKIFIDDRYQKKGDLIYKVPKTYEEDFSSKKVSFVFGTSGYSEAILFIPGSSYNNVVFPICSNNHYMLISDCADGNYQYGYVCNKCRIHKPPGFRWFCGECNDDYCFNCDPCQPMHPLCSNAHFMERRTTLPKNYSSANCDGCGRTQLQHDSAFYHCAEGCNYDYCLKCSSEQTLQIQLAQTQAAEE